MENYEYSKEFPFNGERAEFEPGEIEAMKQLFYRHKQDLKENPRVVIPFAAEIFNCAVKACEQVVKEFSGRIKAKIDYSRFEATIEMWCLYAEFNQGEFMDVLKILSENAIAIHFMPLISGELHIQILMPYFVSAKALLEEKESHEQKCE